MGPHCTKAAKHTKTHKPQKNKINSKKELINYFKKIWDVTLEAKAPSFLWSRIES